MPNPEPLAGRDQPAAEPFDGQDGLLFANYRDALEDPKKRAESRDPVEVEAAVRELETLRKRYPHVVAVEQELALACIECSTLVDDPTIKAKFCGKAHEILSGLLKELKLVDEETLGKMGRLYKEYAWAINPPGNPPGKEEQASYRHALDLYEQAYRLHEHYYPGINVATLHLLLDEDDAAACKIAEKVMTACSEVEPADRDERIWVAATQGEAHLILSEYRAAITQYRATMALEPSESQIASPRRHARCILAKRPPTRPDPTGKERVDEQLKQRVLSALQSVTLPVDPESVAPGS